MQAQARGEMTSYRQTAGVSCWSAGCDQVLLKKDAHGPTELSIGPEIADPCRWHPATLWLGVGCERNTSSSLVQRGVEASLLEAGLSIDAVAGLASVDRKADESALLQMCADQGWPFRTFEAEALNQVSVPTPSEQVRAEMGTASVAEAAASLGHLEMDPRQLPSTL